MIGPDVQLASSTHTVCLAVAGIRVTTSSFWGRRCARRRTLRCAGRCCSWRTSAAFPLVWELLDARDTRALQHAKKARASTPERPQFGKYCCG